MNVRRSMPNQTHRLSLPYLQQNQAQKHVTLNEALSILDARVLTSVISRTASAEPGSTQDSDLHILPADRSGP